MSIQPDNFCPAPWMTFYVEPSGRVDMCCVSAANLGNLHHKSLPEILKSDRLVEIKQMMLANQPIPECKACHQTPALQRRFIQQFGGKDHVDYQTAETFKLKYLDLRWNNTCNFACIYCYSELSSLWAQIDGKKQIKINHMRDDLFDFVVENAHTLEEIYLAGGEPLMIKENIKILSIIKQHNPKCRIFCNTNLSQIENNEIFDLICGFDHVHWQISGETVGSQYEYLRWPGKWNTFDNNIRSLLRSSKPKHHIGFNLVWLNLNGIGIWDYLDYLANIGVDMQSVSILPYNMDNWQGPWHLKHMPKSFLEKILERMSESKYHTVFTYHQNLGLIQKLLDDPNHKVDQNQVLSQMEKFDCTRHLNSRTVFPEIYSFLTS